MFTHKYSEKHSRCRWSSPSPVKKHILNNDKQINIHTAIFYQLKEHVFLQQCCQAAEEGMISTLVGWDTDALRRSILAISNFLFGYVNANQAQLINPTFLNK